MDKPDIWIEESGPSTRLFYRCRSRFTQKLIYVFSPLLVLGLLALVGMTFQTGNATETIAICAISIWFGWLVYRFHQREYVYEMTFEPGVLRANDRRFKLQDITSHGRSEMGGDVVVAGASLPQNFIVGPHLFISVDGRQLPITPPMKSDRAARLHRDFEALYDRYKAMPAD